jgi:hypothetical protein
MIPAADARGLLLIRLGLRVIHVREVDDKFHRP